MCWLANDGECKLAIIESRQAERSATTCGGGENNDTTRTVGMFCPFLLPIDIGRVIPFESTSNGWNFTVELEAPSDATWKLQESMDIMSAEPLWKTTRKSVIRMEYLMQSNRSGLEHKRPIFFECQGNDLQDQTSHHWNR